MELERITERKVIRWKIDDKSLFEAISERCQAEKKLVHVNEDSKYIYFEEKYLEDLTKAERLIEGHVSRPGAPQKTNREKKK